MSIQMDDFKKVPDFSTSIGNLGEIRDSDPTAVTSLWSSLGMIYFSYERIVFNGSISWERVVFLIIITIVCFG